MFSWNTKLASGPQKCLRQHSLLPKVFRGKIPCGDEGSVLGEGGGGREKSTHTRTKGTNNPPPHCKENNLWPPGCSLSPLPPLIPYQYQVPPSSFTPPSVTPSYVAEYALIYFFELTTTAPVQCV